MNYCLPYPGPTRTYRRKEEVVLESSHRFLLDMRRGRSRRRGVYRLPSLLRLVRVGWSLQLEPTLLWRIVSLVSTSVPGLVSIVRGGIISWSRGVAVVLGSLLATRIHGRPMALRWFASEPSGTPVRIITGSTASSGREASGIEHFCLARSMRWGRLESMYLRQ